MAAHVHLRVRRQREVRQRRQLALVVPLMHRRLLRGEPATWYVRDLLTPLFASAAAAACWRVVAPVNLPMMQSAAVVGACLMTAFLATVLATPSAREELFIRGSQLMLRLRTR